MTRTMGMALTACTPPAKGSPLFELGDDEMEMGVGIHGEPGRRREKLASANEIVDELLEAVVTDLPYDSGDDVALMINGLGGTPISELYLLYGRAHEQLAGRGINVRRSYVGEYCTSLDMAGARSRSSGSTTRSSRCLPSLQRSPCGRSEVFSLFRRNGIPGRQDRSIATGNSISGYGVTARHRLAADKHVVVYARHHQPDAPTLPSCQRWAGSPHWPSPHRGESSLSRSW